MAFEEYVAGGLECDCVFEDFAGFEELGRLPDGLSEACSDDAVGQVPCRTVRLDIDEAGDEVGVGGGGCGEEVDFDWAGDFCVAFEWRCGEDEDVLTVPVGALVEGADLDDFGVVLGS